MSLDVVGNNDNGSQFTRPVPLLMIRCMQRDLMNAKHPFGKVPIVEDIDADGNITKVCGSRTHPR